VNKKYCGAVNILRLFSNHRLMTASRLPEIKYKKLYNYFKILKIFRYLPRKPKTIFISRSWYEYCSALVDLTQKIAYTIYIAAYANLNLHFSVYVIRRVKL
jgi:hypothetical protein